MKYAGFGSEIKQKVTMDSTLHKIHVDDNTYENNVKTDDGIIENIAWYAHGFSDSRSVFSSNKVGGHHFIVVTFDRPIYICGHETYCKMIIERMNDSDCLFERIFGSGGRGDEKNDVLLICQDQDSLSERTMGLEPVCSINVNGAKGIDCIWEALRNTRSQIGVKYNLSGANCFDFAKGLLEYLLDNLSISSKDRMRLGVKLIAVSACHGFVSEFIGVTVIKCVSRFAKLTYCVCCGP
jgi:hypothetical protein